MAIFKPSNVLAQKNLRQLWPFSDMADEIRVIVCVPACCLRRQLTVSPSMTINDLKQCLPNPDCDLLQGGSILAEAMPLTFYSIADGAMLVAVAKESFQEKDRWAHLTRDQAAFEERMTASTNPRLALENARLRDLRMRRIGDRPSTWAKLKACITEFDESRGHYKREPTEIPVIPLQGPSAAPLPVWWEGNSARKRNWNV
jgi:hypothetical protein